MKFELWQSIEEGSLLYLSRNQNYETTISDEKSRSPDLTLIWSYEAKSYFDAMQARNDFLGHGKYEPQPDWEDVIYETINDDTKATRFEKLKAQAYKEKLLKSLSFLDPKRVYSPNEYIEININHNLNSYTDLVFKKQLFSIYDENNHQFLPEEPVYKEAKDFLLSKLKSCDAKQIVFIAYYDDRGFYVECNPTDFLANKDRIFKIVKYPIIHNLKYTKLFSLTRLEYALEVVWS